jgi:hypothetical protein
MRNADTKELPHHEAAARMWGQGGRLYDDVSFAISDALARAAQRLNAGAGERILDVATAPGGQLGTWLAGTARSPRWTSRRSSWPRPRSCPPMSGRRSSSSPRTQNGCRFRPRTFDGFISTFGVMFALDQAPACAGSAQDAPTARQERVSAPPARMPSRCTESGRASAPRPRSVVSPTAGARAVDWRPRPG